MTVNLFERDAEMGVLREAFAAAVQGRGETIILSGVIGAGKTALLHEFNEFAAESGGLVLASACGPAEQELPLGLMEQLFRDAPLSEENSRRVHDVLREASALTPPLSDALTPSGARMIRGLCTALLDLADSRPVVVSVDDVQSADPLSQQCLLYLARRIPRARLLLLLNERTGIQAADRAFRADLTHQPHCRRLKLGPLSAGAVAAMLGERLDTTVTDQLAGECHAFSGGNPLLVRAVVDDQPHRGEHGRPGALVPGEAFADAVLACLHRSGAHTVEVARGLALLGDFATPEFVGALIGAGTASVTEVLERLEAIGLLEGGRFRHPVGRTAVLHHMGVTRRVELHLRAAELLHREGVEARAVAEHLVAADGHPGPWAVSVLQDAATREVAGGRVAFALDCLELARRSCADERRRAVLTVLLADTELRSSPSSASTRHLSRLNAALREGELGGRLTVTAIDHLLWFGHTDQAGEALERLRGSVEPLDAETTASLRVLQRSLASSYPGLLARMPPGAVEPVAKEPTPVTVANDPVLHAAEALASVLTSGPNADAVTAAEQILQSGRLTGATLTTLTNALYALIYADRLDLALPRCDALLAEARARKFPTGESLIVAGRAEIAVRLGDLAGAEECASAATSLVPAPHWGVGLGVPLASRLLAATATGRFDVAESVLDQAVPQGMFGTRFELHYRYACGDYYLATGRPHAALGEFQICGELMADWGIDTPGLVPWRVGAAQAMVALEERAQARRLVEEQLARGGTGAVRSRGVALRVLASTLDPRQRFRPLREAVDILHGCGARLELARAFADLSQVHQMLGSSERARMIARRAWQLAKACQAEPLCQQLMPGSGAVVPRAHLSRPVKAGGVEALSDAERRVAALAGQGLTNREIARKLRITVSTVEQHLTRAYRKLNVRRRTDLPAETQLDFVGTAS
ncbi:hypothetical protein BLA24_02615 [Streptomyces cinnamoneus]|uniref:HTH luxR-type domain-containing protein n=1 Tax=Streptomyces cinnamoneus TaxID=53446 RepID=A0A2G1XPS8_STRCJ|nr:LuxR family transcriptional regulator [Streptomyces cinnamoneus]PHQ53226.1 hypothetical protein BLA24_02615 [Streptomyces cinnamoneus]PPT12318.1 LuxR family transcriptional regulator [Streptomyces cinnamoneus]